MAIYLNEITVQDLLDHLDGWGLVVTDYDEVEEGLEELGYGLSLDTVVS